jgi:hypothetical protein
MIKFFRRIRQGLLTENKFSKYVLYAIGEIVLVIIGILIALQLNNWKEQQKLNSNEQEVLKDLRVEVTNNIVALKKVITEHEKSHTAAQKIRDLFDDRETFNEMSESSFEELFRQMDSNWTYDPNNGILNSIISSGKIKDITNKELKYLLASIKDKTTDAFEETMKIEGWRNDIWNQMIKYAYTFKEDKIQKLNFKNLFDVPEFRLYNAIFNGIRGDGLEEEKELMLTMEQILTLIESEIDK